MSQYTINSGNEKRVAQYYANRYEDYYSDYIYSVVEDDKYADKFGKIKDVFPNEDYKNYFKKLKGTIEELGIPQKFTSIIDADIYFFGLIYYILFKKKEIDVSQKELLKQRVSDQIIKLKKTDLHTDSPNDLKYMRIRLIDSVNIYNSFLR